MTQAPWAHGPISPKEIARVQYEEFPGVVWKAFNSCIARNYYGRRSKVLQDDVIKDILTLDPKLTRTEIFARGYLNVETAYMDMGWTVHYDKPGYNESYDAFFEFSH